VLSSKKHLIDEKETVYNVAENIEYKVIVTVNPVSNKRYVSVMTPRLENPQFSNTYLNETLIGTRLTPFMKF
jgi:hypothetical protein